MDNYEYLIKYPFSNQAKEYIASKDLNILDISQTTLDKIDALFSKLLDVDNYNRFFNIDELKIKDKKTNLEEELVIFPVSKIILSTIDNTPLFQSFANYHQNRFIYFLNKDYQLKDYGTIEKILKDICPKMSQNQKGFFIPLVDLLGLDLGEEYKLQYTNLEAGNIYFSNKEQLTEFLAIVLKKRILRNIEVNKKELSKELLSLSEKIKEKFISIQRTKSDYDIIKPQTGEFPPCFDKLYSELLAGQKLSHIANYHLAVFLCAVGYTYEEVLEAYRHLPNFDEKIAGYQIKKILEKKYSVANCETLRSNNLCVKDCGVKHPLQLLKKQESKNSK